MKKFIKALLKLSSSSKAFALPTVVITATVLMITGVSVAQTVVSISTNLRGQSYNHLADEAAQAAVSYATSCINKNGTSSYWTSSLKPNTDCTGTNNGGSLYLKDQAAGGDSPRYRATFAVSTPDGSGRATAEGTVELVNSTGSVTKTWTSDKVVVVNVTSSTPAAKLSVGGDASCALTSGGDVYCAGNNSYGRLGNNSTTNTSTPVQFQLPANTYATKVIVGGNYNTDHICALVSQGNVYCAGNNFSGALGNGNTTTQYTPVKFQLPAGAYATDVSISPTSGPGNHYSVCALTSPGNVYCAGDNDYGQLGNGNTTDQHTPVKFQLPASTYAKKIAVSSGNTCALTTVGSVYCAGINNNGELGNGTHCQTGCANASTPVKFQIPAGTYATDVAKLGSSNTCALLSNGEVYCAGFNYYGTLGNGNTTDQYTPVKFQLPASTYGSKLLNSSTSTSFTCVLTTGGDIYCAGYNIGGQFGNGTTTTSSTPTRFQLPSGAYAMDASISTATICTFIASGDVYCAGSNTGNGAAPSSSTPVKFQLPSGAYATDVESASDANSYSCALVSSGDIYCAGNNFVGQFGNGTTTASSTPTKSQLP